MCSTGLDRVSVFGKGAKPNTKIADTISTIRARTGHLLNCPNSYLPLRYCANSKPVRFSTLSIVGSSRVIRGARQRRGAAVWCGVIVASSSDCQWRSESEPLSRPEVSHLRGCTARHMVVGRQRSGKVRAAVCRLGRPPRAFLAPCVLLMLPSIYQRSTQGTSRCSRSHSATAASNRFKPVTAAYRSS